MLSPNTLLQERYLVLRLLGQGGMGAVYQATDRKFGNTIAVKETFYSDEHLRRAFSQEARLLNGLRHAALPVVMDYFSIGEKQFLVMQYIPGKDLEQLLEDRIAKGQGTFLTSQVMEWVHYLEVISTDKVTVRATGMMPLALGSRFKFHFRPRQSGYLYLVALGKSSTVQVCFSLHCDGYYFI